MAYRHRVLLECVLLLLIALALARLSHLAARYSINWEVLTCFQTRDVFIGE